jgi:hypothetical protein
MHWSAVHAYVYAPGGGGFFVQLIIKFGRIYPDMNESSGTPRYKYPNQQIHARLYVDINHVELYVSILWSTPVQITRYLYLYKY